MKVLFCRINLELKQKDQKHVLHILKSNQSAFTLKKIVDIVAL